MVFAEPGEHEIGTLLGSCVAVCLWDRRQRLGGMNHFLLPLWNGEGLASPRYGNVAIARLIELMRELGSRPGNIEAKLFGGGTVIQVGGGLWNIGERNAMVASDLLAAAGIPVTALDVGGAHSRRIRFLTATGEVYVRRIPVPHGTAPQVRAASERGGARS